MDNSTAASGHRANFSGLFRYVAPLCASKDQKNPLDVPLASRRTP